MSPTDRRPLDHRVARRDPLPRWISQPRTRSPRVCVHALLCRESRWRGFGGRHQPRLPGFAGCPCWAIVRVRQQARLCQLLATQRRVHARQRANQLSRLKPPDGSIVRWDGPSMTLPEHPHHSILFRGRKQQLLLRFELGAKGALALGVSGVRASQTGVERPGESRFSDLHHRIGTAFDPLS